MKALGGGGGGGGGGEWEEKKGKKGIHFQKQIYSHVRTKPLFILNL